MITIIDNQSQKGEAGRGLIWSHSGLYSLHSLVEDEDGLWWETEVGFQVLIYHYHNNIALYSIVYWRWGFLVGDRGGFQVLAVESFEWIQVIHEGQSSSLS